MILTQRTIFSVEPERLQPWFLFRDLEEAPKTRNAWWQTAGSVPCIKFMKTDPEDELYHRSEIHGPGNGYDRGEQKLGVRRKPVVSFGLYLGMYRSNL